MVTQKQGLKVNLDLTVVASICFIFRCISLCDLAWRHRSLLQKTRQFSGALLLHCLINLRLINLIFGTNQERYEKTRIENNLIECMFQKISLSPRTLAGNQSFNLQEIVALLSTFASYIFLEHET